MAKGLGRKLPVQLEHLEGAFAFEKGTLLPSQLKGEWGDLFAEINLEGTTAQAKLRGNGGQLLGLLSGSTSSLPLDAQATAKWEKGLLRIDGGAQIAGEAVTGSGVFALAHLTAVQWKEAEFQADKLTVNSYGALLPLFLTEVGLTGNLQCQVNMVPGRTQVQFGGENLIVHHPVAELTLPQLKTNGARLVFEKEWRGEIPLVDASLHYLANGLHFENIEGTLKLAGDRLQSHSFYAECEGLALRGNAELTFADQRLAVATSQIAGDTGALQNVLKHFPVIPQGSFPVAGNFSSGEKGFVLNAPIAAGEAEWSFRGAFDKLEFPVNGMTAITEGSCEISFDSKKQQLLLENGEGTWTLKDGMPLVLQLKKGVLDAGRIECALKAVDGRKEFANIEAKAIKSSSGNWEVVFDAGVTQVGGLKPNITRCVLNKEMQVAGFEMKPVLRAQDFAGQIALFQNTGFLSEDISVKNIQELQLEGTVETHLATENLSKGFSLQAQSRDLKMKGSACDPFQVKAQKVGEKWQVERLEAGGLFLKGVFAADAAGISSTQFEGSWQGIQMKGSGFLKTAEKRFACTFESLKGDLALLNLPTVKGTFVAGAKVSGDISAALQLSGEVNLYADMQAPLLASVSSVKTVRFTYSELGGVVCEGVDLQCKHKASGAFLASLKSSRIGKVQENLQAQQIQYTFSPAFLGYAIDAKLIPTACKELEWEGNLEGSGELTGKVFQGTLKPGRYGYAGKSLPFEQLQVRYEKELLTVRAQTLSEEEPLWGALQVAFTKEMNGALKLFDNPKSDGLKILFSSPGGNFAWESIQGSCYGLSCNLSKSTKRKVAAATVLTGEVKVDGSKL
ncbi:MAG: hypothetical protein HYX67_15685, partial [Candidatus Melainabacteria bacterium]|nr:hypothetical protein [Candidatus Melainabacteria bacterium]